MTKEQEEAIEILNKTLAIGDFVTGDWVKIEKGVRTVLNLIQEKDKTIQEQQAEVEKKDKIINNTIVTIHELNNTRRKYNCRFSKECNENGCGVCIYKYFERKVEE